MLTDMKIKTVIFDLDGTLLDTLTDLHLSVNFALNLFGYPPRSRDEIRSFVGNGIRRLIILSLPNGEDNPDFEKVFAAFKEHYKDNCRNNTHPYAGISELLEELKNKHINIAIVSNKADFAVKELNTQFFSRYVTLALGECEGIPRKPSPDLIFASMERLNSQQNNSIYVGDSEVDIKTAENAGIPCISVLWGFRSKEELKKAGGKLFAAHPKDILEFIK